VKDSPTGFSSQDAQGRMLTPKEPTDQLEQKYSVEETAEFLGITVPTVYSKKSKGELPACKAPGSKRLFFFKSDLIAYLKQGRQKTNAEIEAKAETYLLNTK
jgi:excisionase family DNA binding protein